MSDVLILDYETMSKKARRASVVSLSAIACDWEDIDKTPEAIDKLRSLALDVKVSLSKQKELYAADIDSETVAWWRERPEDIINTVLRAEGKVMIHTMPILLMEYCKVKGVNKNTSVLIRAPHFDHAITEFWFEQLGYTDEQIPYPHWRIRDVRSIIDTSWGVDNGYMPDARQFFESAGLREHVGIDDCIRDLIQVKCSIIGEPLL